MAIVACLVASGGVAQAQVAAPANDNFASAQTLTSGEEGTATASGSNVSATLEPQEPVHYGGSTRERSIWYRWVAPADGSVVIDTQGSTFDTVLAVYRGASLGGLTSLASNDDYFGTQSRVKVPVTRGTEYSIAVASYSSGSGAVKLQLAHASAPANDAFAAARDLGQGAQAGATGNTLGATRELNEPRATDWAYGEGSVWYSWTAPSSGALTVDTAGSNFNTVLGVFTGDSIGALTRVASNDDANGLRTSRATVRVQAGTTYRIVVDGYSPSDSGSVNLDLSLGPLPANDAFAAARNLGLGTQVSATGSTLGASREANEPRATDWAYGEGSIWYSWTAPSSGALTVDTTGSGFNTVLGVYTGNAVGALARVASNDDAGGQRTSRAIVRVQAGTTYRIQVEGYSPSDSGSVNLNLSLGPLPTNDLFALATPLPANGTVAVNGSNAGAGVEVGEPNAFSYDPGQASVWYAWTAPRSGSLTIRTTAEFQSVITAYTGTSLTGLNRVATQAQQAFNGGAEQVRIRVEAGVTYRIQIDGRYGAMGAFALSLNLLDVPANDDFANAISLSSQVDLSIAGNNLNATQQVGEPIHDDNYCDPSVWYSWTAPVSGGITLDTSGSEIRTVVGVYTGSDLASLARVPTTRVSASGNGDLRFLRVEAGVTYRISVDGVCGAMGNFRLAFSFNAPALNDLFALAEPLEGATDTATGDLIGATGEVGEPNPGGSAGATVWYSWRAPSTGAATVKVSSGDFYPGMQAYTGDSLQGLTSVAADRWGTFRAEAGVLYRIAVHGNAKPDRGRFTLSLTHTGSPGNDDFADQEALEGTTDSATGDLKGATGEVGEPNPGGAASGSVWYSWRAPSTGATTIRAAGSSYPVVKAYTGTALSGLTAVSMSDGTFSAQAGTVYRIAVNADTYYYYPRATFSLSLSHVAGPANDDFRAAEELVGSSASTRGSTEGSTLEPGESLDGSQQSVWYTWTAPASGSTTIDTASETGAYFVSSVSTGTGIGQRTVLRSDHHGISGGGSRLTFQATAGTTYRIAIGNCGGAGRFRLNVEGPAAPPPGDPPRNDPPPAQTTPSDPPPAQTTPGDPPPTERPILPDAGRSACGRDDAERSAADRVDAERRGAGAGRLATAAGLVRHLLVDAAADPVPSPRRPCAAERPGCLPRLAAGAPGAASRLPRGRRVLARLRAPGHGGADRNRRRDAGAEGARDPPRHGRRREGVRRPAPERGAAQARPGPVAQPHGTAGGPQRFGVELAEPPGAPAPVGPAPGEHINRG